MIENMRKYTGLMIVVLILLAAGLILTMGNFNTAAAHGGKITSVYGEDIDANTLKKMSHNTTRVIEASGDRNLIYFASLNGASEAFRGRGMNQDAAINFATRRIIIQKEAEKLGIYPSPEKAIEYIQTTMFTKDSKFDKEAYDKFIKEIGQTGFTEKDLVNLVGEFQVYNKLTATLTSGIQAPRKESERLALFTLQTIDATTIDLHIEDYKKNINPTEEQIKEYWTLNEGAYLTKRQLKLSYILANPKFDTPKPVKPSRPEGMTDEDYAKLNKTYIQALAEWQKEKKKLSNILARTVDDFSLEIEEDGGQKFVELSKENGFDPVTTDFFSEDTAPEALEKLRNNNAQPILASLFLENFGTSVKHQIKAPIKTDDEGWFYCKFEAEKPATPKTFEAAKEQVTEDFIEQEAKTAMAKAAEELKTKLTTAINNGKNLDQAAKELDLKLEKFTAITAFKEEIKPKEAQVFRLATIADPKSFTKENADLGDTISLVFLDKRVVYSDPTTQLRISQATNRASSELAQIVTQAYMSDAIQKAEVEAPKIKN